MMVMNIAEKEQVLSW